MMKKSYMFLSQLGLVWTKPWPPRTVSKHHLNSKLYIGTIGVRQGSTDIKTWGSRKSYGLGSKKTVLRRKCTNNNNGQVESLK